MDSFAAGDSRTREKRNGLALAALCAFTIAGQLLCATPAAAQPWTDRTLRPGQRARLLVAAMSPAERNALLYGTIGGPYAGQVPGNARLGIPDLNLADGPAGVGDGMTQVTAFPAPITIAASWDPTLAQQFGAAIGSEEAGKGINVVLGPMMNLDRVPFGGRNFEGFGEDPVLASAMAAAVVRGIQSAGIVATAKHYIDNDQETNRASVSAVIDSRTQHEVYLPAFRACVDAGVGAVMCSYNQINGTFACQNAVALNGWLKGELGFAGWVMSDWWATRSTVASALSGLDMEMPDSTYFGPALVSAAAYGVVPSSRLDDMATRILTSMFAAGLFDRPPSGSPDRNVQSAADTQIARDAASAGTVLLKNTGNLLPLDPSSVRSIAVIGAAGDLSPIFEGGGSASVTATNVVTPRQGISARAGGVRVGYAAGSAPAFSDATALAGSSDVAIVAVGVTSSEGADRTTLSLGPSQDALVSAVAQANPRTIVVVYAPAQVLMPWANQVRSILFGGLPGQEEGNAIASVLFGDVNPSAKLPMTFANSVGDYPASTAAQFPGINGLAVYSEGTLVGYRYFDTTGTTPLFPFGHGLSYTSFEYGNLVVDPATLDPTKRVSVSLDVTNTGRRAGAEVVQLYLGLPPDASEPPSQLRAFQKVTLAPNASEHVTFALDPRSYSFWSAGLQEWVAYPGTYRVEVGSSSRDIRASGTFDVEGGPLAGGLHQAESAALSCGAIASANHAGYTGTGFVTGFTTPCAAATFVVTVPTTGLCAITARYSAVGSARTLSVYVNGSKVGQATFPPLANLAVWDFETETLDLTAGPNRIAYVSDDGATGQVNLDAIIDCLSANADAGAGDAPAAQGAGAAPSSWTPTAPGWSAPAAWQPPSKVLAKGCGVGESAGFPGGGAASGLLVAALAAIRRRRRRD